MLLMVYIHLNIFSLVQSTQFLKGTWSSSLWVHKHMRSSRTIHLSPGARRCCLVKTVRSQLMSDNEGHVLILLIITSKLSKEWARTALKLRNERDRNERRQIHWHVTGWNSYWLQTYAIFIIKRRIILYNRWLQSKRIDMIKLQK